MLMPGKDEEVYGLRPLTGAIEDTIQVHKRLVGLIRSDFPDEDITPSAFPLPSFDDIADATAARLLWQAARLMLREGAAPLRSLGRISIRPRTYQFVPLLMALRLDPIRMFIADDVGVGKTIEALLIARELLDRGEIRSMAVLAPPYLCDQWTSEMRDKFNLDAVTLRSSTITRLERNMPLGKRIYKHYPFQVISIDWVKTDRNRHLFLEFCPDLVIVDEAHGAAQSDNTNQQQRHQLLQDIARDKDRHLILLTATPHSGKEDAFMSLLGLLRDDFTSLDPSHLSEPQRIELAKHFVQRTRRDIETGWEGEHCFPKRESSDETYELSKDYRKLFDDTYAFCSELVQTGNMNKQKRRVRYWGALTLLRCLMSSPAAGVAALEKRDTRLETDGIDAAAYVFESTDGQTDDETPTPPIDAAMQSMNRSEKDRLRDFTRRAKALMGPQKDTKLAAATGLVKDLLKTGYSPIVWCRYVATAEYVAKHLRRALGRGVQVTAVTGRIGDDERRVIINEIDLFRPRVLVATDCLSEGINLQEKFTAAIHYDLPWNPNRLEQREGRVDRYGQTSPRVKTVRFYGLDNPIDGAVIEVLLDKARQIHQALGTYVPVPEQSESVMQAVLNALFLRRKTDSRQGDLFETDRSEAQKRHLHEKWDMDASREQVNRTRFAQRALKPQEVKRELEAVDAVLGDPDTVREFVLNAAQRTGIRITPDPQNPEIFHVTTSIDTPDLIRQAMPKSKSGTWTISFLSPTPQGAQYIGRNHEFVSAMARFLMEEAMEGGHDTTVSRCGVIRTNTVSTLTTLLMLRVRYMLIIPETPEMLSEEILVTGFRGHGESPEQWLDNALTLLADSKPVANIPKQEKQELVKKALELIDPWEDSEKWGKNNPIQQAIKQEITQRSQALLDSHKRVRKAVSMRIRELRVTPQFPPDLLGLLILQPEVKP